MTEHYRESDIPPMTRWVMIFINRIGFPIVACVAMWYLCYVTIDKQTSGINELKEVLMQVKVSMDRNTDSVAAMTRAIYQTK